MVTVNAEGAEITSDRLLLNIHYNFHEVNSSCVKRGKQKKISSPKQAI